MGLVTDLLQLSYLLTIASTEQNTNRNAFQHPAFLCLKTHLQDGLNFLKKLKIRQRDRQTDRQDNGAIAQGKLF